MTAAQFSAESTEWLSDSITDTMNWNLRTTDTIVYHETFLQTPQAFSASPNLVKDSKVYYAMLLVRVIVPGLGHLLRVFVSRDPI